LLPKISDYANAPTTERRSREGPQRPVDVGNGRTETECRRGKRKARGLHGSQYLTFSHPYIILNIV